MYTIRFLLGLVCLVNVGSNRLPDGCSLVSCGLRVMSGGSGSEKKTRNAIINVAQSQLFVREVGGNNRGKEVQKFLDYVHLPAGSKWCAAYVSWVFGQAGYAVPRTGWSPSLFPFAKRTTAPKPADVIGIYYPSLGRIAHCGIIESNTGDWIISIEGNTSISGSRDGDGVERKRRHVKSIAKFADWITKKGATNVP